MKVEELIGQKLLIKSFQSKDKALKSLEISADYIRKAKANFKINLYDVTVLLAYNSMFHAARALLFKDGFKERAHWAIIEYLRNKYVAELGEETLNRLDTFRVLRHSTAYGLEQRNDCEEAKLMLEFADEFLNKIRKMMR